MMILCTGLMVTIILPICVVLIGHYMRQDIQETDYGTKGDGAEVTNSTEVTIIDQLPTRTPPPQPTI